MQGSLSGALMPRMAANERVNFKGGKATSYVSNLYKFEFVNKDIKVMYQYVMETEPEIPSNSAQMLQKVIDRLYREFKKNIGYVCAKGLQVFGLKDAQIAQHYVAEFTRNEVSHKFSVRLKPVKQIQIQNFIKESPEKIGVICQMLNINMKELMRKGLGMVELGMGKYFMKKAFGKDKLESAGLSVWRGFKVSAVVINGNLFLQADVCSRVLREQSFLKTINEEKKRGSNPEQINQEYNGHSVVMRYGNNKIFKIEEIDFKRCPADCFDYGKCEAGKISYVDYYLKNYNIKIADLKQPLVKVITKKEKVTQKEGKMVEVIQYGYLIPELIVLTGMTDDQRSDYRVMKELDQYTKLTAAQRVRQVDNMLGDLNKEKDLMLRINSEPHDFPGYLMHEPDIKIGGNALARIKNGAINIRNQIIDPANIDNYVFIYSVGRNVDTDRDQADFAVDKLQEASKAFGIRVNQPTFYEVADGRNPKNWLDKIEIYRGKNGKLPELIILFFTQQEEKGRLYGDLKRELINNYNVPSQVIRRRTLSKKNEKGVLSCASKIILQINVKLGRSLLEVVKNNPFWKDKTVAIAAISFSKGKNGQTVSFVGTTNNELSSIHCDCKLVKSKETLSNKFYQEFFIDWFQKWFMGNQKTLPQVIMVYREGLNEMQASKELLTEKEALMEAISIVPAKAKIQNYRPAFSYILVNRKTNTRMYTEIGQGKNHNYVNPESGSIIFNELSTDNFKQFFLAGVTVNQGTCSPVQFKVAFDSERKIPLEAIAGLTYDQCFNYPNWSGAVRVPGVLQQANKLAKLFSEHVHGDLKVIDKKLDIQSKHFFL